MHTIPWKLISTRQYREYMEDLLEYQWEEQWANGWERQGQEKKDDMGQHTMIDLDYYGTIEELMEVGSLFDAGIMTIPSCNVRFCVEKHGLGAICYDMTLHSSDLLFIVLCFLCSPTTLELPLELLPRVKQKLYML
ncbi:hypothetical protein V6N13_014331 [Hibiscus sabdariffa]